MSSRSEYFENQLRLLRESNTRLLTRINDLELTIAQQSSRISVLESPPPVASRPETTATPAPKPSPRKVAPSTPPPAKRSKVDNNRTFGLTIIADDESTVPATIVATKPQPKPSPPRPALESLHRFVNRKVFVHSSRSAHQGNSFLVRRVTDQFLVCNTYPYCEARKDIVFGPSTVTIVEHDHPEFTRHTNSDSDTTLVCLSPTPPATASPRGGTRLL